MSSWDGRRTFKDLPGAIAWIERTYKEPLEGVPIGSADGIKAAATAMNVAPIFFEALVAISRGLTNGQKKRRETFQSIARAALAEAKERTKEGLGR